MNFSKESDEEILRIAEPIRVDVIEGSNNNSWEQHSRHMPESVIQNEEIKKDVERQWREVEYLSALSPEAESIGIIRKKNSVIVCWKQTSTVTEDEHLVKIQLEEIDGKIKLVSAFLD